MYDIAVIGLGPAGLKAVELANLAGLRVIAFEKKALGGTCLNLGCIPTKSILHCASLYKEIKNCSQIGLYSENVSYGWNKILERKDEIVSKFNKALNLTLSKKINLVNGEAKLIKDNEVKILCNNEIYEAKKIIIATGSIPFELPNLKFDSQFILSSDDMLNLKELPKKIAIVGSGAIGLEWAYILSSLNVDVTVIEKQDNLAPNLDTDLQKRIERILKLNKINFYKSTQIISFSQNNLVLSNGKQIDIDYVLVSIGRKVILPEITENNKKIDLKINDDFTTNFKNVYVIGDVTKKSMLAHSASFQAKKLMDKILFDKEIKLKPSPSVIYLNPNIASVGLKEQEIVNKNEYTIKKVLLGCLAKSWCDDCSDGLAKVIIKDNVIKGAHIVCPNGDDIIAIFNILIDKQIKIDEILDFIFPHPSYCELISEVLLNGK